jgi:hypothetical protein
MRCSAPGGEPRDVGGDNGDANHVLPGQRLTCRTRRELWHCPLRGFRRFWVGLEADSALCRSVSGETSATPVSLRRSVGCTRLSDA